MSMFTVSRTPQKWLVCLCAIAMVVCAGAAHAIGGYIYARTIIKSENGNPYWAAYDDKGQLNYGPTEAKESLAVDKVVLVSAESYKNDLRIWDKLLDDIKAYNDSLPQGATLRGNPKVVHRDKLKNKQFHLLGTGEPPAPGEPPPPGESFTIPEDILQADAPFVVLKAPSIEEGEVWQYPTKDAAQLILAQMPFDPSNESLLALTLEDTEYKSLLLNRKTGKAEEKQQYPLGFYSAFLNDMEVTDTSSYEFWHRNASKWNPLEDKVPGPVSGALMSTSDRFVRPVADVSDAEGKYLLMAGLGPPCNIMESMQNYVTAMLYTSSFNPRRSTGVLPYYLQKTWYMPCSGWFTFAPGTTLVEQMVNVNVEAINATLALPRMQLDFAVDMIGVAGKARVENRVVALQANGGPAEYRDGLQLQGWTDEAMKKVEVAKDAKTTYRLTDELKSALEKRDNEDEKRTRELQPKFDLDGDGTDDTVKRGRVVCIQRKGSAANTQTGEDPKAIIAGPAVPGADNRCQVGFEKGFQTSEIDEIADKDLQQGIYFAGADTTESNCAIGTNTCAYPSVVKLLDDLMVNADQGLLKSLNLEDLRNTDVYVFRESTGELIAERTGLKKDEYQENCEDAVTPTGACDNFKDGNPRFFYRMEMRGMHESAFRPGMQYAKLDETFKRWQVNSGMNPALYEREANHLKPGESIKVIAINRATGYLGSVRTMVSSNDANVAPPLPEIIMGPPNLKVWAKHTYKVKEGATKDEIRNYLIGNEGAAKADDMTVEVYTEWLDQDGSPLPAGLKDFGYTGRIARISGKNVLQAATGSSEAIDSLAHFPIKPGRNLQVVKVEGGGSQHLYVQVNGEPMTRLVDFGTPEGAIELNQRVGDHKPDFKTLGAGEQLLQYRPKHYVPILTPIFNENDTLAAKQLAQQNTEVTASSVDGIYQWRYRPEYQVSVYDLMVKELNKQYLDENGNIDPDRTENILDDKPTMFSPDIDLVQLIFDLKDFVADPLDMFSTEVKELVFGFGEEEVRVKYGANGSVYIDNLETLTDLALEDYLTMRLYQNNDTANILWEYAFPAIEAGVDNNGDGIVDMRAQRGSTSQTVAAESESFSLISSAIAANSVGNAEDDNVDMTSPMKPFRFWVNNNYDVVNNNGTVDLDKVNCDDVQVSEKDGEMQQKCEQWDEADGGNNGNDDASGNKLNTYTNTSGSAINKIESEKDLEDFFPMYIKLPIYGNLENLPEGVSLKIEAHNIHVNLYRGKWEKGSDYLDVRPAKSTASIMAKQLAEQDWSTGKPMHLWHLSDGEIPGATKHPYMDAGVSSVVLTQSELQEMKLFQSADSNGNGSGVQRFLVEGTAESPYTCAELAAGPDQGKSSDCFLQLSYVKDGWEWGKRKIYIGIFDIKHFYDHYSVGIGELQNLKPKGYSEEGSYGFLLHPPKNIHVETEASGVEYDRFDLFPDVNIPETPAFKQKDDYVVMVHGWRMKYPERVAFGETSFKRMYWKGYRGRFGLFSWPTGWFDKPAHVYGLGVLGYVSSHEQNYNNSESLARNVGPLLGNLLKGELAGKSKRIIAHSMGNVVVGEALLSLPENSAGSNELQAYIASQAAESAGAYKQDQEFMIHRLKFDYFSECLDTDNNDVGPEDAWRCYNDDVRVSNPYPFQGRASQYDMPPNFYSFRNISSRHGPTTPDWEDSQLVTAGWGHNYYRGMSSRVGSVVNFYNSVDLALNAWEFNQLTKPDWKGGPTWEYAYQLECGSVLCSMPSEDSIEPVSDIFDVSGHKLHWTGNASSLDTQDILSHFVPSRTKSLGQASAEDNSANHYLSVSEIGSSNPLSSIGETGPFNNSNQGHSAQFYGSIADEKRSGYWNDVINRFDLEMVGGEN